METNTQQTQQIDKTSELEKKIEELTAQINQNNQQKDYEAKLDKIVEEKVQERLKEQNKSLEDAKKIVAEAEERANLQRELNENIKYKTQEEKFARIRNEIIFGLNEVVRCGDSRNYNNLVFDLYSDSDIDKQTRVMYVLTKKHGAEKVADLLIKETCPGYSLKYKDSLKSK